MGGQVLLQGHVVRQVLQRDGRLDGNVVDAFREQRGHKRGRSTAVGPHGAAVDDAGAQALAGGEAVLLDEGRGRVFVGRPGDTQEVERHGGHGQLHRPRVRVADVVVVGDQVDGHAHGGQLFVGRFKVAAQRAGGLVREDGFVHLHFGHAQSFQLFQDGFVVGHQGRHGGRLVQGGAFDGLGEADQRVGANHNRHRGFLADGRLAALDAVQEQGPVGGGTRQRGGVEFGDHVVVVGVEEFRHVERGRAFGAARHGKVFGKAGQRGKAGGGQAQVVGPVQDLWGEGKGGGGRG